MSEKESVSAVNDLEYYATQQELVGEEICRISRNFRKDPEKRKTLSYLCERRDSLEQNWEKFDATDSIIRDRFSDQLDHSYFKKDYFEAVRKIAERLRSDLIYRIDILQAEDQEDEDKDGASYRKKALQTGAIRKDTVTTAPEPEISKNHTTPVQPRTMPRETLNRRERFLLLMSILDKSLNKCSTESSQRRSDAFYRIKARTIEQNWDEITALYKKMEEHATIEEIQSYFDMQDRVELALMELCEELETPKSTRMPIAATMKLPKIELPKFDGNYLHWRQFYDLFKQLIHEQPIPPAQKLYFLRANVTGEAHNLIQHFQPTDNNYEVAWKTLVDRFDNRRLLLTAQLNKLLSQSAAVGTASSLRRLHDSTKEGMQAIMNLGFEVENWDPIVVHLMLQKMDKDSRGIFEQSLVNPRNSPTLQEFLKFVELRFQTLEAINSRDERKRSSALVAANSDNSINCTMCNSDCERDNAVRRLQICRNCLKPGHYSQSCQSRGCQKCDGKHNTLLHRQQQQQQSRNSTSHQQKKTSSHQQREHKQQQSLSSTIIQHDQAGKRYNYKNTLVDQPSSTSANAAIGSQHKKRHVYLATAIVNVISSCGSRIPCRALLDSGSQLNFITSSLAHELGQRKRRIDIPISGIGGKECKAEFVTNVTIESRTSPYRSTIEASIMPKISEYQPTHELYSSLWKLPPHVQLADPTYSRAPHIDMLLGAEIFFDLLMPGDLKISNDLPKLRNTKLGWIVAGSASVRDTAAHCHVVTKPSLSALDILVRQFWESENHDAPVKSMSKEEHDCEAHFIKNTKLNTNNQFVVRLPFKEDPGVALGESFEMAKRRFLALERRLDKVSEIKSSYIQFMEEYQSLGHMTPIGDEKLCTPYYVLPHHCVMKPDSSSTKLRVVFDASAKSTSGYSLNDILMIGPTVQLDLFSIITNFRMHRYVFTGDITKMYRQILADSNDRMLQLILWRPQHDRPLGIYQLNTVTYGTASASYLATRCLIKLADDNEAEYPRASQAIKNCFYVDDCLTGAESLEDAQELLSEICHLLKLGNFELRKFCANHPKILEKIPKEYREELVTFHQSEVVKTLGLIWDPSSDAFKFKFDFDETNKLCERVCKRTVLADLARLFDPLGLLGPVIVLGKLFLQELWKTKLAWDDQLPEEQSNKWLHYLKGFTKLKELSIPRYVSQPCSNIELHAFSDSSLNAFGSCVYLRSIDDSGNIFSQLVCSKSRIGPLKATTIARLELQGAVLMVELVARLLQLFTSKISKVCYYTDSTTVLAWIRSPSYTWEAYVANRVSKIQANTDIQQWHFIKGNINPADILSRGANLETLLKTPIWFNGPDFLTTNEKSWERIQYVIPEDIPERRKMRSVLVASTSDNTNLIEIVNHRNSFYTLQKVFAYCFRFYNNCRKHESFRNGGPLTVEELQRGTRFILVYVQKREFPDDYHCLQKGNNVQKGSSIASLSPFFDEKAKLIRVGGRLKNSSIMADAKHQILLPKNNCITKLLLTYLHRTHMHVAPRSLIAISRQRYWILSVGRMARQIVSNCVVCFRLNPKPIEQMMGNLPKERVNPSRPFQYCGVDFCGPVKTHYKIRGKSPTKSYLAVFVCFSTKAVHIEVVGDLSADSFINALKRFIGRRGVCHTIFCDNATNFVGAKNELMDLQSAFESKDNQLAFKSTCLENGINWKYIPPRSPHFGGLWEAAVKSAKRLLIRYIREASLTYEELLTVVIQIEAILNSRPLTPMSSDPNDLEALTPGHFLIGSPLTTLPEPDVTDCKFSSLKKFRQIQHLQQHFWKRWSWEYLHLLQQRMKWAHQSANLAPGTMVVIKETNVPPMKWKLGRVEEVIKGNDDLIRVATVKTQSGTVKRAIHNLCPLPISEGTNVDYVEENLENDNRHTEDTCQPTCPRKPALRSRNITKSLLSMAFMVLLIFPSSLSQTTERVNITQLDKAVGIYFEDIGKIQTTNSHWNIYVYYNLTTYILEFREIKSYLQRMEEVCTQEIIQETYCKPTIEAVRNRLATIEHNNELLYNYNMGRHEKIRARRSPLDIVGKLANSLFGVLDQDDAKHIEAQIHNVNQNEHHLMELIRKQSSIADSTTNLLKRNALQINQQFQALNAYLAKTANGIKAKLELNDLKQNIVSLTSYLILVISNFERVQEILLDVLLDLNHARINPQILTPHQLAEQIMLIKAHLPTTLTLVKGSATDLYKMASVKGRILEETVVFEMRVPLADTVEFQLFNLIPIPILQQSKSYLIETFSQFLAISRTRDEFFPLSKLELNSCNIVHSQHFLCNKLHPTYTKQATASSCEIALLNHKNNALHECKLKKIPTEDHWISLMSPNRWIFSTGSRVIGHLICKESVESLAVAGNGLLEFKEPCILKMPTLSIKGELEYNNSITIKNSFIPKTNISAWVVNDSKSDIISPPEVNDIDKTEFIKLKNKIDMVMHQSNELPREISLHDYHHYGLSYLLLAGMIGIVVAYCCHQRRKPKPAPRSSRFQVNA